MGTNTFLAEKLCRRGLPVCLFALCVTLANGNTAGSLLKEFRARSIAAEAVYWGVCGALLRPPALASRRQYLFEDCEWLLPP